MLLGLLAVVAGRHAGAASPPSPGVPGSGCCCFPPWRQPGRVRRLPTISAPTEARALVERDLAQWLAQRSEPGTIAFAPPKCLSGSSFAIMAGLRVVRFTPSRKCGKDSPSPRAIAGTPSTDEAQALIQRRGIQYIVLRLFGTTRWTGWPKLGSPQRPNSSLIALLRPMAAPRLGCGPSRTNCP